MSIRFQPPVFSPNGDVGQTLPGGLLYFYENGSSTTLKTTYSDAALTTPHTNPVVADGDGRFAQIFGSGAYSVKLTDADGNNIWGPFDDIELSAVATIETALAYTSGASLSLAVASTGLSSGDLVRTSHYDSTKTAGSGAVLQATGITTAGKAGNCPDADGYFYDADGKQFAVVGSPVSVLWFGAVGDGTDDTAAIQAADDYVSSFGGVVIFPVTAANYTITNTITKGDNTLWKSDKSGSTASEGAEIVSTFNGVAVSIEPSGATSYNGYAGIDGVSLSSPSMTLAASIGIELSLSGTPGAARQQYFKNFAIYGFVLANIKATGGGEYYFIDIFSSRSEKSLWLSSSADSHIVRGFYGSGPAFANPNTATCHGLYLIDCNNIKVNSARLQVNIGGSGLWSQGLERCSLNDLIVDQNEGDGLVFRDFDEISIIGGIFFDNGTTLSNKSAINLTSTGGNSSTNCVISGVLVFDRNKGDANEVMDKGINFVKSGTDLANISVDGNFVGVTTPLNNPHSAAEVHYSGNIPIQEFKTLGDTDLTWRFGRDGFNIRQNVTLTAGRTITLGTGGVATSDTITVTRTSGGAFNLGVYESDGVSLLKNLAVSEWGQFKYNGTEWEYVAFGSL